MRVSGESRMCLKGYLESKVRGMVIVEVKDEIR